MKIQYEATLLSVVPHKFDDRMTGEPVEYDTVYFEKANENGDTEDVVVLNTKQKLGARRGMTGMLSFEVDTSGKNKPRFLAFETK